LAFSGNKYVELKAGHPKYITCEARHKVAVWTSLALSRRAECPIGRIEAEAEGAAVLWTSAALHAKQSCGQENIKA